MRREVDTTVSRNKITRESWEKCHKHVSKRVKAQDCRRIRARLTVEEGWLLAGI